MYKEWNITIPGLTGNEPRKAYVYVPDSCMADDSRRCPVLYMFDGQNLFRDSDASYGKCWGILDYLTEHNIQLIVAALECNHHAEDEKCGGRLSEYSPFDFTDPEYGSIKGRGKLTMDYIVKRFKPYIDKHYPTLPEREFTFVAGSSMGGIMTVYALLTYNDVFSRGAALSPSFAFSPASFKKLIRESDVKDTVLYMDNGSLEMTSVRARRLYGEMTSLLIKKGLYVESRVVPGGIHSESSWEQQVPFFLNTIFYQLGD